MCHLDQARGHRNVCSQSKIAGVNTGDRKCSDPKLYILLGHTFPPSSATSKAGYGKDKQYTQPSELGLTNTKRSTQPWITKHLRRTYTIKEI